jgi:hypothetical protein
LVGGLDLGGGRADQRQQRTDLEVLLCGHPLPLHSWLEAIDVPAGQVRTVTSEQSTHQGDALHSRPHHAPHSPSLHLEQGGSTMQYTRSSLVSFGVLALNLAYSAPSSAQAVGVAQTAGCGVAVMRDGTLFLSVSPSGCGGLQGEWASSGNMFALAGRAPSMVAGMTTYSQVLGTNGDWFQIVTGCPGTPVVIFQGNVFAITGFEPSLGEEFTAFGGGAYGLSFEYAVTSLGNVFRWQGTSCPTWVFAGALPIGPTPASRASWGALKLIYR